MRRFRALGSLLLLSAFAVSAQELAWKEFRSAEDGFSVLFPGTPKVTEEKLKGFVKRYFTVQNGRRFKVTITDVGQPIPQNVVERVMNVARDGLASSVEGKVSDERAVKCGQHPGRRLVITSPDVWVSVQMCVAGNRTYQVEAASRHGPLPAGVVARFHNSFKLFPISAK